MKHLLMTGATGLLGGRILRTVVAAGRPVAVLARSHGRGTAESRVTSVLDDQPPDAGKRLGPARPVVLESDLLRPDLGLGVRDRAWIRRNCDAVLHCAASLSFVAAEPEGEPYRTNVAGTRNLLRMCRETGLREFHHVSTAYVRDGVSGPPRGTVLTGRPGADPFSNDYERSKFQAESLVLRESPAGTATIYRPSIIVGDSRTARTSTFHGFYVPLRLVYSELRRLGGVPPARPYYEALGLTGSERKNLVPVDWVATVIAEILRRPDCHGKVYHLTNPRPVPVAAMERAWVEASVRAIAEGAGDACGPATSRRRGERPEAAESRAESPVLEVYRPYFEDDPSFEASGLEGVVPDLPCPELDHATLVRLSRFAIEANFGWPVPPSAGMSIPGSGSGRTLLGAAPPGGQTLTTRVVRLELGGPDGGTWWFRVSDAGAVLRHPYPEGLGPPCPADDRDTLTAYASPETLAALGRGTLTPDEAVGRGRLVLEGSRPVLREATRLVADLCRRVDLDSGRPT